MSTAPGRTSHAKAILDPELYSKLANTSVLLVGAGGIGCELLKNIVLTGFGKITVLDLDTIDISNLNRQFLFKKKDVKQPKALVAAQTAAPFNPNVRIIPIHDNIKEPQYDIHWYQQFDMVLNALDNLDARRHVNKMCMAAQVPLVESGTAGYLGQVQPLLKDTTECFDCIPKPTPKTFPVCTIRSTPSQPIHCIVWSKSYLMGQLFGEDEDAIEELDDAEKQGENSQEIETLRKEAQAFKTVRQALRNKNANDAAKLVFQKVFNADIKNLLIMADMWRSRSPPIPLDYDAILDGTFKAPTHTKANGTAAPNMNANGNAVASGSGTNTNGSAASSTSTSANNNGATTSLKDQRTLTLKDNLELFISSTDRLAERLRNGEETISFDKDDDDTLDFVTASSNLRSYAYGIEGKTRWEVKEMAGNIIPAIATTNAIIAGLIVLQALHVLKKDHTKLRNVYLQFKPAVPLSAIRLSQANPECGVCRDTYAPLLCDPARTTLGEVVKGVMGEEWGEREVSVYEDKRVLSDPDWEDNFESTLESLSVTRGKFLSIVDEEGEWATISLAIANLPPNYPRPLPVENEDGVIDLAPTPKKPRIEPAASVLMRRLEERQSPSKRRRLEADGLVVMDGPDDVLDSGEVAGVVGVDQGGASEVIVIDDD
ncbi:hypothetical protein CPB84DRAFT_1813393 [Gymnopilus junonius]|uniref:Ubiquitin-activating enzyme E1-like n=1 Tax=Gymnopilus junonius TaxID=109634 RepID=A0A9P5NTP7_GYMJU|nr:hypothetical protein CPB84DRAFT_1813393 [Gymnopilus junonius]